MRPRGVYRGSLFAQVHGNLFRIYYYYVLPERIRITYVAYMNDEKV